jgi:hypothetical protein
MNIEHGKEQIKLLKDQGNICDKLEKQVELIDSQLKLLERLKE